MILALNANAAIDQVLFIDRFLPGGVMRPNRSVLSVGGKSLDAAVVIKTLGGPVEAVSFIAGENGKTLQRLLESKEIPSDLLWVEGETRVSYVIVETEYNRHSHITTTGYHVSEPDCALFLERIKQHAPGAAWAVLAGSLPGGAPADFYGQQIALLHQFGVKSLIDTSAQAALGALPASPDIVKMNQAEFCATFPAHSANLKEASQEDWIQACREVIQIYRIQAFVLTCGKDGILALTPSAAYHAASPLMQEVNAAGSGDAVSGTLAYRLSMG
ncbi:MAG: hypothetical protein IH586_02980, partial [Anaerolineaceae bacterium]|nr:hypothetical protein [Anaerolineaceae bacterium]